MTKRSLFHFKFLAAFLAFSIILGISLPAQAEEYGYSRSRGYDSYSYDNGYQDDSFWNNDYSDYNDENSYDDYGNYEYYEDYDGYEGYDEYSDSDVREEPEEPSAPGYYTVASGWSLDSAMSTESVEVYRQDDRTDAEVTSTISCSYMNTNYSIQEYEQLRDMLTNNLLYENVNAQISTSAVYTQAKDYLYIIAVDDPAEDFRNIYHYVVGDYICFCVQVKEYRSEADENTAQDRPTPQQAGQSMAESFVWN